MKQKVIFYLDREDPTQVFAYFPNMVHNGKLKTSYAHIGQHSTCHPDYVRKCKKARPDQYELLKIELEGIGYVLEIYTPIIDKIVDAVNCRFGSPMGRHGVGTKPPEGVKVYDRAVPMSGDGIYDKGGAYWGLGKQLRVRYTKDLSYVKFYRQS